jgi:hypothetical protein
MATTPKEGPHGMTLPGRAHSGRLAMVERRRSPSKVRMGTGMTAGTITLTVMRAMVAATDALRAHLESEHRKELTAADLTGSGGELADLVRRYQLALRHFVKDWLRDRRQLAWLVDGSSGRTLAVDDSAPSGPTLLADTEVVLAEDQTLNGIRRRLVRDGLGLPIASRQRRTTPDPVLDPPRTTAARPWTVLVGVARCRDRRLRTVQVELRDPAETATHSLGGVQLPLAADFTAPVALTLGLERKPAAAPYGLRDTARRWTIEGFSALTPFGIERAPLVLLEGGGLSPTMLAQVANEVAGDPELRERYQVWLYRYPVAVPLFFAASVFRGDLARFATRIAAASGRTQAGRVVVIARGAGSVIVKSLLADSGSAVWNAVFNVPPERLEIGPRDRALLERLFRWRRSVEIDRVVVLAEPENAEALVAGVGARAVQLVLHQPANLRGAIERIYGREKNRLAPPLSPPDPAEGSAGAANAYPEPVCDAIAAAALAADRALLDLVAAQGLATDYARLYRGSGGLRPVDSWPAGTNEIPGERPAVRRTVGWLRPLR